MSEKKEESKPISRRSYLKYGAAGVVVVAAAAGGAYYYSTMPPAPAPAPTTTMAPTTTAAPATVTVTQPASVTSTSEWAVDKGPINVLLIQDPFFYPLQALAHEFTDKTGIQVNLQGIAYDEVQAKAVNSFITKTPGVDVVTLDNLWLGEWANNGWIAMLDDVIKRDAAEINFSDFIPTTIYSLSEWLGHFWTLPIACYSQNVIYRVDVLEKLGLKPPPTDPKDSDWWTWDVYMDYIKKMNNNPDANKLDLSGKGKMYGTVVCGAAPSPIEHMYTQLAASKGMRWFKHFPEVDPSTGQWDFTTLVNSKENLDALKFYTELYHNSPPEAINYVWFDCGTAFGRGNIGMFYWWTPYNYLVNKAGYMVKEDAAVGKDGKQDPTKYNIGLLPQQPGYPQVYSVSAWSFVVDQYSAHKGAAWEFIKWATSADTQKKMGLDTTTSPYQFSDFSRYSLYKDPDLIATYPYLPIQEQVYAGWTGAFFSGKLCRPCIPPYFILEGEYGPELNKAVGGQETAEVALKNVEAGWNTVLTADAYIPKPVITSYDDTLDKTIALMKQVSS